MSRKKQLPSPRAFQVSVAGFLYLRLELPPRSLPWSPSHWPTPSSIPGSPEDSEGQRCRTSVGAEQPL